MMTRNLTVTITVTPKQESESDGIEGALDAVQVALNETILAEVSSAMENEGIAWETVEVFVSEVSRLP